LFTALLDRDFGWEASSFSSLSSSSSSSFCRGFVTRRLAAGFLPSSSSSPAPLAPPSDEVASSVPLALSCSLSSLTTRLFLLLLLLLDSAGLALALLTADGRAIACFCLNSGKGESMTERQSDNIPE
jgi:hypothetical protein